MNRKPFNRLHPGIARLCCNPRTKRAGARSDVALSALLKRRRSLQEQEVYENDNNTLLKNYLLPGVAAYNQFKSIGAETHMSDCTPGSASLSFIEDRLARNKGSMPEE